MKNKKCKHKNSKDVYTIEFPKDNKYICSQCNKDITKLIIEII